MSDQPKIVIFVLDQLAQRAVGCYGNADVRTPTIDKLARHGVRFTHAYTPCPLCMPARAAFWTGRWPHQTQVLSNGDLLENPTIPVDWPTLGSLFAEAGYRTVHVGKTHDAGSLRGFEVMPIEQIKDNPTEGFSYNYDTWQDLDTTDKAIDFLADQDDSPFLLVVDLNNPHNICGWIGDNAELEKPMMPPRLDEDLMVRRWHVCCGLRQMPVPVPPWPLPELIMPHTFEDLPNRPRPVQYLCCAHRRQAQVCGKDADWFRHYLGAYYHYIELVDAQIRQVLITLEAAGHDDAMLILMSDHGDGMGCRGMATKHTTFYDETTRVPLIFAGPGVSEPGRVHDQSLVSLLDLVPTLCDVAGIATPPAVEGRSLASLLGEPTAILDREYVGSQWYSEWGYTIEPGRMIRTRQFKYTRYLEGGGEELFDLGHDPDEQISLVTDPAHADTLAYHRGLMDRWMASTEDDFNQLACKADPQFRSHRVGYDCHIGGSAPDVLGH